ncbi:MAG: zinc-ribbon and DUF3426 domain-containing protein [Gammaproteobacteria bacterium]
MTQRFRTTCPHCASVFRLGSEQLDAASGWVQCGVCGTAFDAYPALIAETPEPAAEPAPPVPSASGHASAPATPPLAHEAELPSIILIDPDQATPEEPGPLPEIPPPKPFVPVPPRAAAIEAPAARIEYAQPLPPPEAPRRRRPWLAALASVLLLVTLAAQSAYFLRDTLASRYPETRPALEQACAVLGCGLSLPKNLALLQVVGSDLQSEGAGQLRLNLTLGNRAGRAQAWPILVLTLTDQRNQPLARRSFAPSEYLSDARLVAAGMPPRTEQPLSLALTVRDLAPMGFNLQLRY